MPFEKFHVSPLLIRPKSNYGRRVIGNLSYPEGHSVNSNIESDSYDDYDFHLSYPTIDNVDEITKVGEVVLLYKLDISRAFHYLRIDPGDYGVMGLHWDHNNNIDVTVVFGYKHGSTQMQRLRDTIRHIMMSRRFAVFSYIDIIGIQRAVDAHKSFDTLKALVGNIGLVCLAKQFICMGILVDVQNNILKVPDEKKWRKQKVFMQNGLKKPQPLSDSYSPYQDNYCIFIAVFDPPDFLLTVCWIFGEIPIEITMSI